MHILSVHPRRSTSSRAPLGVVATVAALASLVMALGGLPGRAVAVEFGESLEAVRASGDERPVVLLFGAPWCGWCKKLKHETLSDESVEKLAERFAWVEVDIDDEPELAALFHVRGVPHTAVLDGDDQLLASASGFMTPDKFTALLEKAQDESSALPSLDWLLGGGKSRSKTDPGGPGTGGSGGAGQEPLNVEEQVRRLIDRLARPDRAGRKKALAQLEKLGAVAFPQLVELLDDPQLALRAAAGSALRQLSQAGLPFSPFDSAGVRTEQVAAWKTWLSDRRETVAPSGD